MGVLAMKLTDTGLPDQLAREILPLGTEKKEIDLLTERLEWAWKEKKEIQSILVYDKETHYSHYSRQPTTRTTQKYKIRMGVAAEWARRNGFTVRPEILERLPPDATQSPPPGRGGKWPWGDHETELLRHLAEAAERFWTNYDPEQPDTAPTNEQVADWLVSRGVSKNLATSIATILRADNLPAGRRK